MKKIACYVRVSATENDQALQKREINRWLKSRRFNPKSVKWYIDKVVGGELRQPKLEALQADIQEGRISTVVLWRLDRLSLFMPDGLDILIDWCGKSLRVVSVSQEIDFGGKNRTLVASVLRGVMEMDQNTRREQTKAGLEAAKSRGVRLGRPSVVGSAKVTQAKKMRKKGKRLVDIAEALDISKTTAGRYVNL